MIWPQSLHNMGNGIIDFEIEGVKYSLFFGMVATEIITNMSVEAAKVGEVDNVKAFAYIVYGGLCNKADAQLKQRPEFEAAYMIADAICSDDDLSAKVYSAWQASKPCIELMKKLNSNEPKKKDEVKPKSKTGMK